VIAPTPLADALAQKAARIERCVARAREELAAASDFRDDQTRQDAAILNVQRAEQPLNSNFHLRTLDS